MADPVEPIYVLQELADKEYTQIERSENVHVHEALLAFADHFVIKADELRTEVGKKFDEVNANQTLIASLIATKIENLILKLDAKMNMLDTTFNNRLNQLDASLINTNNQMMIKLENKFTNLTSEITKHSAALSDELESTRVAVMSIFAGVDNSEDYHAVLAAIDTNDYQTIINTINKGSILYTLLTSTMDFEEIRKGTGGNLIAKAIRELGIRFDIMEARSELTAKHTKGNNQPNIHSSVKQHQPDVYNSYVEAKNNAITSN